MPTYRSEYLSLLVLAVLVSWWWVDRRRRRAAGTLGGNGGSESCDDPGGEGTFDVYLINLNRAPERLASFQAEYDASDMKSRNFIRRPAVEGAGLPISEIVSRKAFDEITTAEKTGYRNKHYQLTRGACGAYMSHVDLWKYILETGKEGAYIFEDDAVLPPDLNSRLRCRPFPAAWDLVLLGFFCNQCDQPEWDKPYRKVHRFFGLQAYCISKRGIDKILQYKRLFPIEKQIDAVLSDMIAQGLLNVYATRDSLVRQNNKFATQIQIPLVNQAGIDPWATE